MKFVGQHWSKIETGLKYREAFVPGVKHLTSVNTLNQQALEDDFVQVEGDLVGWQTKQGDLAAVYHCGKHLSKIRLQFVRQIP